MLKIRNEQMTVFEEIERQDFVERMAIYLKNIFPNQTASIEESGLHDEIRYGMKKAERYFMGNEREVARYIELMFYLDRDFDTSPDMPWAAPILNDPFSNAASRLRRLSREAGKYGLVTYPVTSERR